MVRGEEDAVVFVADTVENSTDALRAVVERAKETINGCSRRNTCGERRWNDALYAS